MSGAVSSSPVPSDQPSIIYGFEDQIREVVRSGFGEPGPSPGDIVKRESTKSTLEDRLPELEIPGRRQKQQDDCGEDIPAFACEECGKPQYVSRTCYSPICEHCWPAKVKQEVIEKAGKLDGLRRLLYSRMNGRKKVDLNHVVASLPDFRVQSKEPLERALLVIKTLLEEKWGVEGFLAVYHPYRIKKEYRKEVYDHGGDPGEGTMRWKDVLNADNWMDYVKYEPHFHLFFPAVRASFDYFVAEAVHDQSGWLFHRITKDDEENENISVSGLDDLVHQLTYALSHAGIEVDDDGEPTTAMRMKGELHNTYAPDDAEAQILESICKSGPRLLGYKFVNREAMSCDAELDDVDEGGSLPDGPSGVPDSRDIGESGGLPEEKSGLGPKSDSSESSSSGSESESSEDGSSEVVATSDSESESDNICGGNFIPMSSAGELLEDEEWVEQAPYSDSLRSAREEWQALDDKDGPPDPPPVEG